jgi:hypothetical protein
MINRLFLLSRAFFIAIKYTLMGKKLSRYPRYAEWVEKGVPLIEKIFQVANEQGFNTNKREDITLMIDGRSINMEVILRAVEHNLKTEYPHLLEADNQHTITAITASNINDQYRIKQLCELESIKKNTALRQQLEQLLKHLNTVPAN